MAHEVRVRINTGVVGNKNLEIIVKTDSGKLGALLISRGNVEWLPKGNSVNKTCLSWAKFAEVMKENGKPAKQNRCADNKSLDANGGRMADSCQLIALS